MKSGVNQRYLIWHPNWVRFAQNGTNLGPFQITFKYIFAHRAKMFNSDLKKFRIGSHLDQSDPIWAQIWSPWFGQLQMKQQGYLDDGREITAF